MNRTICMEASAQPVFSHPPAPNTKGKGVELFGGLRPQKKGVEARPEAAARRMAVLVTLDRNPKPRFFIKTGAFGSHAEVSYCYWFLK